MNWSKIRWNICTIILQVCSGYQGVLVITLVTIWSTIQSTWIHCVLIRNVSIGHSNFLSLGKKLGYKIIFYFIYFNSQTLEGKNKRRDEEDDSNDSSDTFEAKIYTCYSTITWKVLLNRPHSKLGIHSWLHGHFRMYIL